MITARSGRFVFGVGFVILLLDGAAAIWLGQIAGRGALVVVGLVLVLAAAVFALIYRRWLQALADIAEARRELQAEIGALRGALGDARAGRHRDD
jgi:hypothetical protein